MKKKDYLTQTEVVEYFSLLKQGKKEYRDKIIIGNYGLVRDIAKKYVNAEFDYDDVVSMGTIGLIKAVDSYDLDRNIEFAAYASRCITNEIFSHFRHKKNWISLDDPRSQNDGDTAQSLLDKISDDYQLEEEVIHDVLVKERIAILRKILPNMKELERKIIYDYYGIDTFPQEQDLLAQKYGISQSYVSKIHINALHEMKNWILFIEELERIKLSIKSIDVKTKK